MEKRFIIFVVISFLILAGWQLLVMKFYPEPKVTPTPLQASASPTPGIATTPAPTNSTISNPNSSGGTTPTTDTSSTTSAPTVAARQITVVTPFWKAVFDNRGAILRSFSITHLASGRETLGGDYKPLELVSPVGLERVGGPLRLSVNQNDELTKKINESFYAVQADGDFIQLQKGEQKDIIFKLEDGNGLTVEKRLHFYGDRFLFDVTVDAAQSGKELNTNILIGPNFGDQSTKHLDTYTNTPPQSVIKHSSKVTFVTGASLEHRSAPPDTEKVFAEPISWIGGEDHYFSMVVVPAAVANTARVKNDFYKETVDGAEVTKHLISAEMPIANKQVNQVFIGPKDRRLLSDISREQLGGRANLEELIDYGFFGALIKPIVPFLEVLLILFYKLTHNYGWAIVMITVLINLCFFPLKWKSSVAMKKAVKLQPKMKEISDKIKAMKKDDPRIASLQMEQMKLMKEGNPLSGCLPLLLQMPIFWAIYIYLSLSHEVRHMPFIFWIKDLSAFDPTYILPIIMTVSMMASTALTPTPNDPNQKMQKYMTSYIMPIVFLVFFFAKAPSGLVLYWMFSNIIGVVQQLLINKMTTEPTTPIDVAPAK